MKILYDHQIFTMQAVGGISRYFSELIKRLNGADGFETKAPLLFSNNIYMSEQKGWLPRPFMPGIPFPKKRSLKYSLNQFYTTQYIQNGNFDVFHPTYYSGYFLSQIGNKPVVVTVYDMIHEKLPEYFPGHDSTSKSKERIVNKADKIITISKQTRDDLIEMFGVDESKIETVHLGNSLEGIRQEPLKGNQQLPEKYMLFVGRRGKYKNFMTFVKSVTPLVQDDEDLFLVCVGGGSFSESEKEFLNAQGILGKLQQINCSDAELKYIYRNARCYVFPSLYEGFGLPILEAFSEKCPVACSHCGSLPEVAGDGSSYFDPESEMEIRNAVTKVLYDEKVRENLIKNGVKRSADFSWDKTAMETKKVYESLL